MYLNSYELSGNRERAAELNKAFNTGGWTGYLRKQIELEDSNSGVNFYQNSTLKFYCFVALGENDKALNELDKLFEMHVGVHSIKVDPMLATLRDEPRYKELIKKVGFPE